MIWIFIICTSISGGFGFLMGFIFKSKNTPTATWDDIEGNQWTIYICPEDFYLYRNGQDMGTYNKYITKNTKPRW